jgi:hypothetical protein
VQPVFSWTRGTPCPPADPRERQRDSGQHTHLVDPTPKSGGTSQELKVGATFHDPMSGISVTLVSEDVATGVANVQIEF